MIIDKVKFTKKEQSEIRRAISNDQIRYIRLRAENRYISSFGAKYGYDDNFFANYLLAENLMVGIPQEDKEKIRQDILSDVCEILSAVTKEEVEKELDNRLQEFIDVIPTDEPHRIAINVFTNRYTVNYKNCWSLLNEILFSQISAYNSYKFDSLDIIRLSEKKVEEWYGEIPQDKKEELEKDKKAELIEGIIRQNNIFVNIKNKSSQTNFGMVHQNSATNTLTKIKPKEGKNTNLDIFTGVAEMKKGGLTVVMKQFREINIRTSAFMLYDFLVMRLTENGAKSPVLSVSLDDYMSIRGLSNVKEARKQVKEDLETLYNISISFEEKRRGGSKSFHDLRVLSDKGIKNGIINISFGMGFYSMLVNCPVMPYCKEIFKLDTNKYRHAYALYGKIQEHKNMNIGKKNENIISVKTLLDAASAIPTYDEVMKLDRHIELRIKTPFEENMNALAPMITWEYCSPDGTSVYTDGNTEIDYQTFINLNVRVSWLEYPDQTKRMETKAKRIADSQKDSKKKKKKDEQQSK